MTKKKLSRDQKRKQKKRKQQARKKRPQRSGSTPFKVMAADDPEYQQRLAEAAAAGEAQMVRIQQVFGVDDEDEIPVVKRETVQTFIDYLESRLQLPCVLTGIESVGYFDWEERFDFGYGSKAEYEQLRRERGSYHDRYELAKIEPDIEEAWDFDALVEVRRLDDGKRFAIPLSELQAADQNSDDYVLLNDYSVWIVN
jgi:hypothetical protein